MPAKKAPRWTARETAILSDIYPREGLAGAADALSDRTWHAIEQRAHKLGLRSPVVADAPKCALRGERLDRAIKLREDDGWSFGRIAATLGGVSEAGCCNAVLAALCVRKGFRPAARDASGRLLPEEFDRLRLMLRKGLKGVDIQQRMAISAGRVAEERRRYNRELKANGKALLPPPGGGMAYSGVKVPRAKKLEVEQLFMTGIGTQKISARTGVSKTVCLRIRNKLVAKLRRKGETVPGCDLQGVRRVQGESSRFITDYARNRLRVRLLAGEPVIRAARAEVVGASSAYKIRDQLIGELAAQGKTLPRAEWRTAGRSHAARADSWMLKGAKNIYRYRELCRDMPADQARTQLLAEIEAQRVAAVEKARIEAARPKSFEEQMAAIARGERRVIAKLQAPTRQLADITFGGVSAGL